MHLDDLLRVASGDFDRLGSARSFGLEQCQLEERVRLLLESKGGGKYRQEMLSSVGVRLSADGVPFGFQLAAGAVHLDLPRQVWTGITERSTC